jgi:hypothetical protein
LEQEQTFSETPNGIEKNEWHVFVVGDVSRKKDPWDQEYYDVSPIDREFTDRIGGINLRGIQKEPIYRRDEPGQLQDQPVPQRWDIVVAKRVGDELGRASLQVIKHQRNNPSQ